MRPIGQANGRLKKKEGSGIQGATSISYEELLGYAVGVIGMSRLDFEWMTPIEFIESCEAWRVAREREIQLRYEIIRFNAWLGLAPYIDLSMKSQEDVYRFPWEKQKTGKIINGKSTNSISKVKSAIRRGEQKA